MGMGNACRLPFDTLLAMVQRDYGLADRCNHAEGGPSVSQGGVREL
jgi:hypothetical protein